MFDTLAVLLLSLAAIGMAFLFGGTVFWASGIPFALGLMVVFACQIMALRSGMPLALSPPPGTLAWSLLLLYALVRAIFVPVIPYQAWTEVMQMGAVLLFYVTFADLCNRRKLWKIVVQVFLVSIAIQALYALSLHLRGLDDVLWLTRPSQYGMRASGTFICPNHYAQLLQIGILLAVGLILTPKMGFGLKFMSGYTALLALPALFLTGSRSGWLGLLAGLAVIAFMKALKKGPLVVCITTGVFALLSGLSFFALWTFSSMFQTRVQRAIQGDIRVRGLWPDTWRMIQEEGAWGVGPGLFRHRFEQFRFHFDRPSVMLRHAHNEYLHVVADYGWLGLAIVLLGLISVTWLLCRAIFRQESSSLVMIPVTMLGVFVATAVHSVFDFNAHINGNMTTLVLVMGALYGHGLHMGVWKASAIPLKAGRVMVWGVLTITPLLFIGFLVLAMGSWAELRMDRAREQKDLASEKRHAATMRRWTPFHWRGWAEHGYHLRAEAFWNRNPEQRAELVEGSREAYETALRWNPMDRIALMGLAELERQEGNLEAAAEWMDALLQWDPRNAHVLVQYGIVLRRLGRYEEALEAFEVASRYRRNDRQIQMNIELLEKRIREAGQED
ncbi:MAG: O-antigen ligase family protein [Verrucomicrobia bacterium]|nr:O-antigen ligase family protein [Verrucomicrobiota bacterium]